MLQDQLRHRWVIGAKGVSGNAKVASVALMSLMTVLCPAPTEQAATVFWEDYMKSLHQVKLKNDSHLQDLQCMPCLAGGDAVLQGGCDRGNCLHDWNFDYQRMALPSATPSTITSILKKTKDIVHKVVNAVRFPCRDRRCERATGI